MFNMPGLHAAGDGVMRFHHSMIAPGPLPSVLIVVPIFDQEAARTKRPAKVKIGGRDGFPAPGGILKADGGS